MKKIFVYLLLLVGALACNTSKFTDSIAVGALSDKSLQNAQGVDLLLTGAYSALDGIRKNPAGADWTASGDDWWFDVLSDDAHKGSTDGDQADLFLLETYDWASGNPYIIGKWSSLFAGENRANAVISLINKIQGGDFTRQVAEARFLRGHFNYELQKIFGNIPYISDENYTNTEFNQPNPGPIWDKIEADFQFAIDNLPPNQGSQVGRANSWAAKAYLGKVLLQQRKWASALTQLQDVINNGPYALLPEFDNTFRLAGENGTESILSIEFTADSGLSPNGNLGGTLNFPGGGPFSSCCGFYQPTQDLVNSFQTDANGLPLLDTFNQTDVKNDFGINSADPFTPSTVALDPRLDYTVGRRGIDYNGWGVDPGKDWIRASFADISGPYLPKKNIYHAGESVNMGTGGWGQQRSGINYHIIRYADVLLMAAEAAVETNDLATALTYVNMVRNRAKNSTYVKDANGNNAANYKIEPYPSFPSQDYARKAVRMERRLELGMEGHRLFDIRRWGNGVDIMNAYFVNEARVITPFAGKARPYQPKFDVMPIPLSAIDLSGGILQQNPGF